MNDRQTLLQALANSDNDTGVFGRGEVLQIAKSVGLKPPKWFFEETKLVEANMLSIWLGKLFQCEHQLLPSNPSRLSLFSRKRLKF